MKNIIIWPAPAGGVGVGARVPPCPRLQTNMVPALSRIILQHLAETNLKAWASADFFPREGKIFKGGWGGQKYTICLKNAPKDTIFFQKFEKNTISVCHGEGVRGGDRGGGKSPLHALPCGRSYLKVPKIKLCPIFFILIVRKIILIMLVD